MLKKATVRDYMAATLVTLTPDMDIQDAINELISKRLTCASVVDQHGNLVGVLTDQDCMKVALNAAYFEEMSGKVKDYMNTKVKTVDANMSIADLAELFYKQPLCRYAVFDEEDRMVGQIGRSDVLRALQATW
jgi:predicted transcriptional regulator